MLANCPSPSSTRFDPRQNPTLDYVAIFVFGIIVRLIFIVIPPGDGLYNVDELEMSLSVLDRWLGLQATTLAWPAAPLQLIGTIVTSPELGYALLTGRHLDKFANVLFGHYLDPKFVIVSLRVVSALCGAATSVLLYKLAFIVTNRRFISVIIGIFIGYMPILFEHSLMAVGDMMSVFFGALGACALFGKRKNMVLVGLAFSLAVCSKVTVGAWLVPVFLGGCVSIFSETDIRTFSVKIIKLLAAGAAGLILFFPYIWIAPLSVAKAIAGNVAAHSGGGIPTIPVFSYIASGGFVLGFLLTFCVAAGIVSWLSEQWRAVGITIAIATIFMIASFWVKGFSYWRYLLGAVIPCCILLAIVIDRVNISLLYYGVIAASLITTTSAISDQVYKRAGIGLRSLVAYLDGACNQGAAIWMDELLLGQRYDPLPLSSSAFVDILRADAKQEISDALIDWLVSYQLSRGAAMSLQTAFDAADRASETRWFGVASILGPGKCEVYLYRRSSSDSVTRHKLVRGSITRNDTSDIEAALRNSDGRSIYVIGDGKIVEQLGIPIRMTSSDNAWAIAARLPRSDR